MKTYRYVSLLLLVVIVLVLVAVLRHKPGKSLLLALTPPITPVPTLVPNVTPPGENSVTPSTPTPSTPTYSPSEALKRYVQRMMQDPSFEGRTPLNFYGKVLDDTGQPVAGATVSLDWSTNGVPGGYKEQQAISDAQGLFALTGEHGKHLKVEVHKMDYYTVDGAHGGNFFFEYADPSSPDYHQPDEHHPVVFYLRRKGPSAAVKSKTLDTALGPTRPQTKVNFLTGFFHADGQLTITVDKPDYRTARGRFPWSVTLSVAQGGLVETDEQFPFLAPANGYAPSARIDMTDPSLPTYDVRVTRTYYFFLQDTNTYGHVTVETMGNNPALDVSYVYNPQAGNRVLEPAPTPTPGGY